ncbi:hypothetical protein CLOM_g15072 [Closterium sp. NIES-68]|nr:hypothetical protein CLOM_g15072 [Closterium sp. NIES-68]
MNPLAASHGLLCAIVRYGPWSDAALVSAETLERRRQRLLALADDLRAVVPPRGKMVGKGVVFERIGEPDSMQLSVIITKREWTRTRTGETAGQGRDDASLEAPQRSAEVRVDAGEKSASEDVDASCAEAAAAAAAVVGGGGTESVDAKVAGARIQPGGCHSDGRSRNRGEHCRADQGNGRVQCNMRNGEWLAGAGLVTVSI